MAEYQDSDAAKRALAEGAPFAFIPRDAFAAIGGNHLGWKLHVNVPDNGTHPDFSQTRAIAASLIEQNIPFKVGNGGLASEGKGVTVYVRNPAEFLAVVAHIERQNLSLQDHPGMMHPHADDLHVAPGIAARFCTNDLVPGNPNALFTRYGARGIGFVTQDLFFLDPKERQAGNITTTENLGDWPKADKAAVEKLRLQAHKAHLALFGDFYLTPELAARLGSELPPLAAEQEARCRRLLPLAVIDQRGPSAIENLEQLNEHPKTRVLLAPKAAVEKHGSLFCLLAAVNHNPPIGMAELPQRLETHGIKALMPPAPAMQGQYNRTFAH
jgi:hypothetical protein